MNFLIFLTLQGETIATFHHFPALHEAVGTYKMASCEVISVCHAGVISTQLEQVTYNNVYIIYNYIYIYTYYF